MFGYYKHAHTPHCARLLQTHPHISLWWLLQTQPHPSLWLVITNTLIYLINIVVRSSKHFRTHHQPGLGMASTSTLSSALLFALTGTAIHIISIVVSYYKHTSSISWLESTSICELVIGLMVSRYKDIDTSNQHSGLG